MSDPIVAGLPSIASLNCANTLISASLEFVPANQVTAGLFRRSVSGTPLAKALSNGSVVSMFYASAFDPGSTYYIALAFDPVNGPWGLPATLVWQQPQLTTAVASLDRVEVAWSLPSSTTVSGVRASLYDTGAQTALVTVSIAGGAGARLVPPLPLKPNGTYTVSLTGVNGMASGPVVVSSAIPVASPVIASAVYASTGAGTCGVSVTLSQPPSTQVVVRLLRDGIVVQQATSASSPVALALARPLDPRARWQVDAGVLSGSMSGPPCAPFALQVPEVPAVSSVFYAGGAIDVRLASSATPGATVALFKGTPTGNAWMASTTTSGSSANLLVDPSLLQSGFIYTIALTLDATATAVIWGPATTLVWQQPTLVSVAVVGQSVNIGWTLPATTTVAAVNASIYDNTAMAVVASGVFLSNGARLQLATPLNPAHAYAVSLAGANGIASSAAVSSPALIPLAPSIARAVYEPVSTGGYRIAVTPVAASSPPGPVIGQLLASGTVVATQAASDGTVSFALPRLLDTAVRWQVVLLYQSGVVSGPTGIPVDIPLQAPQLATARCDGTAFDLAWSGASGAVIALLCLTDRTVVGSATVTNGFGTRVTPSSAIDAAKTYAVTLAPITGSAQGLAGPQVHLIVAKPSLSAIAADGAQIAVSLTGIDPAASASELQLASAAGSVMTVLAGLDGGYLPQPQGLLTGLTLSARAVAGGIAGPPSNAAAVIVATPSIASIAFTGTAVTGVATAPAGLALDAAVLNVRLCANEIPFGATVRAATNGSFSVPAPSTGSAALTLTAFLSGTVSGVPAVAPSSPAFPVLASAASIRQASLVQLGATAWQLVAEWLPPADPATGNYEVALTQDGAALQRWTVAGTALEQTAPSFSTQKALTLTVTPLGPYGRGPASATATFLPAAIATMAARLDGSHVSASWTANTAAGTPTAFRLRLVQATADGAWVTVAQSPPTMATTARLELPCALLDAAAQFGVTVDAAFGNAWVATQTTTALVTTTVSIASSATTVTGAGRSVAITWAWPGGTAPAAVDAYQPVLIWNGNETVLAKLPATPMHATLDLPVNVPGDASIGLRALAGTTVGPCGAGTPLLVQALAGLTAAFDGAHVDVSWEEPADARVSAYTVTLAASGAPPVVQNVMGTAWRTSFAPSTGQTATVTVCAVAGAASGPVSVPLALVLLAPAITTAGYDGRSATVAWNAVAGATGYAVSIGSPGGSALAEATVGGTTAALPVTLDATQTAEVAVRALIASPGGVSSASSATGPAATARLLGAAPSISMIAAFASQVIVTLDTTATSGAGAVSYQASLYAGDRVVAGPVEAVTSAGVTTATFPFVAQPQAACVARAWALGALAANQPGPPSVARPVISVVPTITQAGYDGTSVQLVWSDATQPGVTGYAVTVTDTTAGTVLPVFRTAARSASIAATLAPTHTYTASVQAIGNAAAGPPSAAANPLADSVGYFFPASATQPYACLFRGDIRAPGPADIVLYLPQIFGTPPASITQDPFVLTQSANPIDPSLPYTLTVAQSATIKVWSFTANGIRDALRTAYLAFLKKVEDPANGLLPGAMALLQQVIAQALPLSFAETLYYSYGYDPTAGYVNLQPGMRLRVDFENRQFVSADPQGALSGFVGAGTSHYAISALAGGATSLATLFDAFLGPMAVPLVSANTGGGAGVIDLQGSRFQQPFIRLFYPSVFASSDSGGTLGPAQNAVIVGAPSITKMDEATRAYLKDRNFTGVTGIFWTYLRGRATLIPELACSIDGASTFVSLGTTVRQLLASRAPLPFGQVSAVRGIGYRRSVGNVVDQPAQIASASDFGRSNGVHFGFQPASSYRYAGGLDCFDVPVLGGDALTLRG